jgi:hypothetical protein
VILRNSGQDEGDTTGQACRKIGGIVACNIVNDETVGEARQSLGEEEEVSGALSEQS